ncbi:MAG TPA: hypothetical protein VKK79_00365 [Candidatus Lokiarchaeia archaeon]|nr:hypothetical protein [Candidatus Lokiarchaeia archaeon]
MSTQPCKHVIATLLDNTNGENFFDFIEAGLLPHTKEYRYTKACSFAL